MTQIRLYFETSQELANSLNEKLDPVFEEAGFPLSIFETNEAKELWTFSGYVPKEEVANYRSIIEIELKANQLDLKIEEEELEDHGWIEKTLSDLVPVRAGRFVVHGSHDADTVKPNELGILVDAGLAFGTGHHGTTAGCLTMIDQELKSINPRVALDLGSGTGVLAIAIAKAKHIPVLASDIDPIAQQVAEVNAKLNGVGAIVRSITATGFNNNQFAAWMPFDLVVANILAGPLQGLATQLAHHLSKDATVILSGLLPHQKSRILASYRPHGLYLRKAHIQDGWLTLVLKNR